MKNGKIVLFTCALAVGFSACENDDGPLDTDIGPLAEISFTPSEPIIGEEVSFNAEQLTGSTEITGWSWNFGDANSGSSNEKSPVFIYQEEGTYEVSLDVSDATQAYNTTTSITVLGEPDMASIVWEYTTGTEVGGINDGSSAPVIDDAGVIYYVESRAGAESKIVAVTDAGESAALKWAANVVGSELPNSPSIAPDGNILINAWSKDKTINKLSAVDGALLWSGNTGADQSNSTVAIDSQGNSYHSTRLTGGSGGMFSWSPNGELRWGIAANSSMYSAPAISADESTVYFLNTGNGQLHAINTADGSAKWTEPVGPGGGRHGSSLSIDADGTIYFTNEAYIAAITDEGETGAIKWQYEADAAQSGVVVGASGELYVGTTGGLLAMNPEDGSVNWTYFNAPALESVPAVDANGFIYTGTEDGRLVIVTPEGELAFELQLGDNAVNSPTIADDGTIYVEAMDGNKITLFKIAIEEAVGPADSAWPMKGQNRKSTGVAR